MAERRVLPTRKDRRQPHRLALRWPVPDGVHAAVQVVEPAGPDSPGDLRMLEPQPEQLSAGYDAVLALRNSGNALVRRQLVSHTDT